MRGCEREELARRGGLQASRAVHNAREKWAGRHLLTV